MKIRSGFVSNSSSSSFIVIDQKPEGVESVKLEDQELIRNIIKHINNEAIRYSEYFRSNGVDVEKERVVWDGKQDVYLTQLISDSGSFADTFEHLPHYAYGDGEHGQVPYGWGEDSSYYWVRFAGGDDEDSYVSNAIFVRAADLPKPKIKKEKAMGKKVKKEVLKMFHAQRVSNGWLIEVATDSDCAQHVALSDEEVVAMLEEALVG